jgi:hypothetical protein
MGDFVGGGGQLIFDLFKHAPEYTPEAAPRQWVYLTRKT